MNRLPEYRIVRTAARTRCRAHASRARPGFFFSSLFFVSPARPRSKLQQTKQDADGAPLSDNEYSDSSESSPPGSSDKLPEVFAADDGGHPSPAPLKLEAAPRCVDRSDARAKRSLGPFHTSAEGSTVTSANPSVTTSPRDDAVPPLAPLPVSSASASPRRLKGFFSLQKRPPKTSARRSSQHDSGSLSPSSTPDGPSPRDTEATTPKGSSPGSSLSASVATMRFRTFSKSSGAPASAERSRKKELKEEKRLQRAAKAQDKLRGREIRELVELILESSLKAPVETLYRDMPRLKFARDIKLGNPINISSGPTAQDEMMVDYEPCAKPRFSASIAGRTVSTYPMGKGDTPRREGSPICDSFLTQVFRDGIVITCVADGCGWGSRNREAAIKAKVALVDCITRHVGALRDTHAAGDMLCKGVCESHYKIIEGKEDITVAGTTAIIGGMALPLEKSSSLVFVFVSVGDCKAFVRRARAGGKIEDLTLGLRNDVTDPKDPGGRIGPYIKGELPDFRNLHVGYCIVEEGDIVVLTSDGVTDNLDPEFQGISPAQLGYTAAGPDVEWTALPRDVAVKLKGDWCCAKMADLLDDAELATGVPICPELVVKALIDYCVELTFPSRQW